MIKIDLKRHRKEIIGSVVVLLILLGGMSVFKYTSFNSGFEIVDDLGGNIFPSAILSVATTDAQVIVPSDSNYLGNPKSCIAVRVKSKTAYSRVRIEVAETPFFSRSVSEFVLNKPRTEYTIYPDIIWNYEALKNEVQAAKKILVSWNLVPFDTYPNRHSLILRTENVRTRCPRSFPFISTVIATLTGSACTSFFRAS